MRVLVCAASLLLLASVEPTVAQNRMLDFQLLNRTGLVIMELYVSPTNEEEWGEDILGRDVFKNGETADITFSRSEKDCMWDLKIVDEDEDEVEWTGVDLCKANHITLHYQNGKPTATIK